MTGMKRLVAAGMFWVTASYAGEQVMQLTPQWEYVADTVMGGVSRGKVTQGLIKGRDAARLTGDVSLENNGGFIQMAFDLAQGEVMDASQWRGVELAVQGNGATYELRLRTDELTRPWQSYRAEFVTTEEWQTIIIPWQAFEARKTDVPFDPARLRRLGVLAIGAEMQVDVAVSSIGFYR